MAVQEVLLRTSTFTFQEQVHSNRISGKGLKNAPFSRNLLLGLGPTALPLDKPLALIQKKFSHHCLLLTMARCPKWHYVWRQILLPKHSFYCQKIINNCHSLLMDQYDCHVLAFLNYCHCPFLIIVALWGVF